MGKRGPLPQPPGLKVLRGRSHHAKAEASSGVQVPLLDAMPKPPKSLTLPEARLLWKRLGAMLVNARILSPIDLTMFEMLCECWAMTREAERAVARDGILVTTPNGHKQQHPCISIARGYRKLTTELAAEFFLTPNDRSRLSPLEPAEEDDADLAFLFGKTRGLNNG